MVSAHPASVSFPYHHFLESISDGVDRVSCMTAALMPFRAAFACVSGMFETSPPQNNYTIIYPIKVYLGSEFDRDEDM